MVRILDTNVLLDRSITEIMRSFESCDIVIPLAVIQELDTFKKLEDSRGRNAREAIRFLDDLRVRGKLHEGVLTDFGSTIRVEINHSNVELPAALDRNLADNRILMVAKGLADSMQDHVVLVTQDICERVIADTLDIIAEDYPEERVDLKKIYTGWTTIKLTAEELQEFYSKQKDRFVSVPRRRLTANQYVVMVDDMGSQHYGRYDASKKAIVELSYNMEAWGIKPAKDNLEQRFLMDLLLNDNIKLVTALGCAGTGKTLLALAAGLQKTIEEKLYRKVIVSRAIIPVGNDIGFLPGDKIEKLTPWMGAIFDNLEFLTSEFEPSPKPFSKKRSAIDQPTPAERVIDLIDTGCLELEALAYIRGRSIPQQWIIIDEAQNITKDQMKTIISRAGEGTKIVITGDIEQVDNHRLNSTNNGLVHVVNSFKGQEIFGHITLTKSERSLLSELAVKLL